MAKFTQCIVGAHELLAIKLVLKERRHWMEQAEHLFVVFTDHDNPHYLQTTKHLNFCFYQIQPNHHLQTWLP